MSVTEKRYILCTFCTKIFLLCQFIFLYLDEFVVVKLNGVIFHQKIAMFLGTFTPVVG